MATLTIPTTPAFRDSSFGLLANTQIFTSPLDNTVQTLELTGARWRVRYDLPQMNRAQAAVWTGFLSELLGSSGRFFGFDPDATTPRGTGNGTPLVQGGSQTGKSLVTDGWANNETVLLIGDYFTVNGEYKMVTADVTSSGSGVATINFVPSLRASPANNAALTINNPTAAMMLVDDEEAFWDTDLVALYGVSFAGVEAFV